MFRFKPIHVLSCLVLTLSSCFEQSQDIRVDGLAAIYAQSAEISLLAPIAYENLGAIVYREPYIFINELYRGIHVVDNTDRTQPSRVAFISIPGCTSFTLKEDNIFADSGRDLVTAKYSNGQVAELNRIEDFFSGRSAVNQVVPPDYSGFFECADPSKGVVVGWAEKSLDNPQCRTN
jgi:hypothetical protein